MNKLKQIICIIILFVSMLLIVSTPFMIDHVCVYNGISMRYELVFIVSLFAICIGWLAFVVANELYKELNNK